MKRFLMDGDYARLQRILESDPSALQSHNAPLALFYDKLTGGDMPRDFKADLLRKLAQEDCETFVYAHNFRNQCARRSSGCHGTA